MTKNELAEQVASQTGLPASQARQALEATIESISDELARGGEVALAGFCKFSVSPRAAPPGTQPLDGRDDPDLGLEGCEILRRERPQEAPQLRGSGVTGSVEPVTRPPAMPAREFRSGPGSALRARTVRSFREILTTR